MATAAEIVSHVEIEELIEQDQAKDLLRFTTAGSVDDGKSTLIGRLLYDSRNVFEDHIHSVARASATRGNGSLDLSLLTDGLRAEREQGITIDVAYRYFATAKRKFIIADTPGHEQYTRNMATGASTADLAIILIDARNGILPQSRRHAYIAALLGIPRVVVAVNKMDAVGYDERVFRDIEAGFSAFLRGLGRKEAYFLPISALVGDNVVTRSASMPWFEGPSLLEHLETVETASAPLDQPFRLPVQYVIRPNQDFRGYAGQVASGVIRPGDEILALPSGRRTRVRSIASFDGNLSAAHAPMSVTITLEDNVDISRGDMLVSAAQPPAVARAFNAHVVWMNESPVRPGSPLLVKHTTQTVPAETREISYQVNIRTLESEPSGELRLNDIGLLQISVAKPLYFDPYSRNRATGCISLIDPVTNATVGAGMITGAVVDERRREQEQRHALEPVTPAERLSRWRHTGAVVRYGERTAVGVALERELFELGAAVLRTEPGLDDRALDVLVQAGLVVLTAGPADIRLPNDDTAAAKALLRHLEDSGLVLGPESLIGGEGI